MKAMRTLTMVIAVVVSGLTLVAVAPAPPAAAVLTRTFTQGSLEVSPGLSPYCTIRRPRAAGLWGVQTR